MRTRNALVAGFGLGGLVVLVLVVLSQGTFGWLGQRPAAAELASPPAAPTATPAATASPAGSPSGTPPPLATGPGARAGEALIYEPENHGVLLFGGATSHPAPDGSNPVTTLADTWLWNGKSWRQLDVQGPPARSAAMVAYDSVRRVVVLFGGSGPEGAGLGKYFQDTWTWDGTQWQQQHPGHMPNPRMRAGMAFDERHGVTVMFGGEGEANATYTATWTWDGVDWTLQDPATVPPARHLFGMAYDAARGFVDLFGGSFAAARLNDTWTWDGSNWYLQQAPPPAASGWAQLAYDTATKELVGYVYYGLDNHPTAEYTIAWNGVRWTDRTGSADPSPRAEVRVAYDPETNQVVLFGPTAETWTWNGTAWSVWLPA